MVVVRKKCDEQKSKREAADPYVYILRCALEEYRELYTVYNLWVH